MKKILGGEAIEKRNRLLCVDTQGGPITQSISGSTSSRMIMNFRSECCRQRDQSESPGFGWSLL
ncbi:MAG: hypothetical protein HGA41_05855 [Syntrophaceae bacterium]|nr:hypothetical protein [Syntrophaceae bacterium]